ncbi:MAG TPA: hypothetical protein VK762_13880 [Polyangiaceae bacterium]|nr:hypothetical protein [Polyangiaceae bacterium]
MAIRPTPGGAQLLAIQSPSEALFKAKLRPNPSHPRALPYLLEALALWQGCRVHAALYADESPAGCATSFYPDLFVDPGDTPLYTLDWVPVARRRRRRDALTGLGDFRDLQQRLVELALR